MSTPPEIEAQILQKQQSAWDLGLIQGFTWLINEEIQPRLSQDHAGTSFSFSHSGKDYSILFEGGESRSFLHEHGEYKGSVRLFEDSGKLLFQLAFEGFSESSRPLWATRGPSAQSAVDAFIEGPWTEHFLMYLSQLKEKKRVEIEAADRKRQIAEKESLEKVKSRFGLS
jgi:hypothetical protein